MRYYLGRSIHVHVWRGHVTAGHVRDGRPHYNIGKALFRSRTSNPRRLSKYQSAKSAYLPKVP